MKTHNHIVVYSGGMDSFTLLQYVMQKQMHKQRSAADMAQEQHKLYALSFNYGQRHRKELEYAIKVCLSLSIHHKIITLSALHDVAKGSALTDAHMAMPEGHYAEESMRQTVVPGRNTVMLAMALAYAEGLSPVDEATIYYGAHSGDHHIYPDCRPEFIAAMMTAIRQGSGGRVGLRAPFMGIDKIAVLRAGLELVPAAAYADTWTCYAGGEVPCGKCGSCDERREAFALCGVADPALCQK